METAKRVLQVLGTTNLGGAESRIMDIYRHIDRDKIQFDFLIHTSPKGHFDDEINELGGRIYRLPAFRMVNYFSYKKACEGFFASHKEFVAVHGHMTSTAAIYLPIAKKAGIPITIAHARSAGVDSGLKGVATKWIRRNLYRKADVLLSCSDLAGEAVFGKKRMQDGKVIILPNAIDTKEFAKNHVDREKMREELGLSGNFVIGHVGRFHYAKNHEYLLDIFAQVLKKQENAVLLMLGDGPLKEEILRKAQSLGIIKSVRFLGNQSPVSPFYRAMDVFVFPSRFEGMPGTVVEAQAAGLPCLISDTITKEVKATNLVSFLSIHKEPELWAEKIISLQGQEHVDTTQQLIDYGYDVNRQAKIYETFYLTGKVESLREGKAICVE